MLISVAIKGTAWELKTAAALLRTYSDRGPISDRVALEKMAEAIEAEVEQQLDGG